MRTIRYTSLGVLALLFAILISAGCSSDDSGPRSRLGDTSVVDSGGDFAFPTDLTGPEEGDSSSRDGGHDRGATDTGIEDTGSPDEGVDGDRGAEDQGGSAPTVEILEPGDEDQVSGDVTIVISAADDDGIDRVELVIDGEEAAELTDTPYEWVWDTSELDFGTYTIEATAFDTDENSASDEITVELICTGDRDCPPYDVTIVGPPPGATVCGVYIVSVVGEDDGGVEQVEFTIDGDALSTDDEAPFEAEWDTTAETDGEHEIEVTAVDGEGQETTESVTVTVDNGADECNNPPAIVITAPGDSDYVHGDVPIEVATSDDVGVASVQFFIDRGSLIVDNEVPFGAEWNTSEFSEGSHEVSALATDTGGKTARDEVTVTVDRTPPEVEIISPERNEVFVDLVDIEVEASDNILLRDVRFELDDDDPVVFEEGPFEMEGLELPSGGHRLVVVASDGAGQEEDDQVLFTVDRPPTVHFIEPEDADLITGPITVMVEAEDDLSTPAVRLYDNGELYGMFDSDGNLWWQPAPDRETHTLRAVALDGRNQEGADEISVLVDFPFAVQVQRCWDFICEPIEGPIDVAGTARFEVTTLDGDELKEVELLVDDVSYEIVSETPFTFEWDSTTVDDGEHILYFEATNTLDEEAGVAVTAYTFNCECNHNADICDAVIADEVTACACDPDCDDKDPCIEDAFCDGFCPFGTDPDCGGCDGIPIEPTAGQACFDIFPICTVGRCITTIGDPFPIGMCHQLCSPDNCEEICGDDVDCVQQYVTGETGVLVEERFDDGRLLGVCELSLIPAAQAYDQCENAGQCRPEDQCIQVTAGTPGQCLPVCNDNPFCPNREGYSGDCAYTVYGTSTMVCAIACDPTGFGVCPSGMNCTRIPQDEGEDFHLCHWP